MFQSKDNKTELKESVSNTLPKELVAFLNSDGGIVYVGIKKDGKVAGVKDVDASMRQISDVVTDRISPRCVEYIHQSRISLEGKDVIKIEVAKGDKLYYIKKYGLSENGCYIRIGSTCKSLTPEEIADRYLKSLNAKEKSIADIPSKKKNLTFKILKNYLLSSGNHFSEETFLDNYHLLTKDGEFNYLAEILSDQNDIVINVATFSSSDKTKYLKRDEFGGKCLLLAMEQAKSYVNSINQTYVDISSTPRKETKMFDPEAFEQAWINACVHNRWSESDHPGIYIYSDRMEIESFGGLPKALTKEQFLKGKSEPVNKKLFSIFRACGFAEESGHGVPTVTKTYGEEAYVFSDFFIDVVLRFDVGWLSVTTRKTNRKQPEKVREMILELLKGNGYLSQNDLSSLLNISEYSIKHHIKTLQSEGRIKHQGPDKGGYWEVMQK